MYGTTRQFLDYFNLKGLDDLPTLMELRDIDAINVELELAMPGEVAEVPEDQAGEASDGASTVSEESPRVVQVVVDTPESNDTIH
jgi:segregation and condensation protein B